jgi:glyoxylase-like metal-dependent hydrolase (beta-lactamase superfamily II)
MGRVDRRECGGIPMTGAEPILLGVDSHKPTLLSSNSVLLQGPERFVVLDAGGEPAILRRQLEKIRAAQSAAPLTICFAQTHAHIDHVAGLTEYGLLPNDWRYEIAAHEQGLRVMHAADRAYSLADLSGRPLTPFCRAGWREWAVRSTGAGASHPDLSIPLGDGNVLEAFCTPGHSPDSVSWRVNRTLFVGDLLAATAPLVAGIAGWDRDALLASLDRLERILETYAIQWVHVGHGKPLDRTAVAQAIARSRHEAGELSRVDPVSVQRVQKTAARADALVDELEDLFAEIARRIRNLADKLAQIQESRTADDVRAIDRSQEVNELLEAFGQFKEAAEARGDGALGVAVKGIQTAMRVSKLLEWERLDWVLDESLLRYARTRVVDFIQRAKGLTLALDAVSTDLGGWTRTFVKRLKNQQIGACRLDDVSGGEEGFRRQLVYCLSRTASLGTVPLTLSAEPGILPARMDPVRFFDALTRVIEDQVQHGATGFALQAGRREAGSVLTLRKQGASWAFAEARPALWEKVFARGGAQVDFPPAGSQAPLVFAFEAT